MRSRVRSRMSVSLPGVRWEFSSCRVVRPVQYKAWCTDPPQAEERLKLSNINGDSRSPQANGLGGSSRLRQASPRAARTEDSAKPEATVRRSTDDQCRLPWMRIVKKTPRWGPPPTAWAVEGFRPSAARELPTCPDPSVK